MSNIPWWLARFGISMPSGSWDAHIARGSAGGVDFAAPAGTLILAPAGGGVVTYRTLSDGSSVARVERDDGTATEFLHGQPVGDGGREVDEDDEIALSDGRRGAVGAGGSTGAHIHVHDTDVRLRRVYPYSTVPSLGGGSSGGVSAAPIRRNHMFIIGMKSSNWRNGRWLIADGTLKSFEHAWNPWGPRLQAAGVWVFSPQNDAEFDSLVALLTK